MNQLSIFVCIEVVLESYNHLYEFPENSKLALEFTLCELRLLQVFRDSCHALLLVLIFLILYGLSKLSDKVRFT